MYKQLHGGQMFYGNLHIRYQDDDDGRKIIFLKDEVGNTIDFSYKNNILVLFSYHNYASTNGIIIFGNSVYWETWKDANRSKDELLVKLKEIGKEKWINGFTPLVNDYFGGFFTPNRETAHEIWKLIQNEVSKIYPDITNVQYLKNYFVIIK